MNKGSEHAHGEILYFLDADVRSPHNFEMDIKTTLNDNYDFSLFSYWFDSDHTLLRINIKFTKKKGLFVGGGDQSLFMKKSTFNQPRKFDESFTIMEDFHLFYKKIKFEI